MIKSMTGFGRAVNEFEGYIVTVELKSVNHRYFEFSSRIPRQYGFIEDKIKSYVNSKISRGKVDCFVSIEAVDTDAAEVVINHTLAKAYLKALRDLEYEYQLQCDFGANAIARCPDVITLKKTEEDEDMIWSYVQQTADEALDKLYEMRVTEGEKMFDDIKYRADVILENVEYIEIRSPQTVKQYNDKLVERVHELIGDVSLDEARIIQEVAIYADKVAVAEETVRLRSHIEQLNEFILSSEPVGRKIDFLIQEINREANTIGSKANDVDIARHVVDIKAEIEKIREQVQNIE